MISYGKLEIDSAYEVQNITVGMLDGEIDKLLCLYNINKSNEIDHFKEDIRKIFTEFMRPFLTLKITKDNLSWLMQMLTTSYFIREYKDVSLSVIRKDYVKSGFGKIVSNISSYALKYLVNSSIRRSWYLSKIIVDQVSAYFFSNNVVSNDDNVVSNDDNVVSNDDNVVSNDDNNILSWIAPYIIRGLSGAIKFQISTIAKIEFKKQFHRLKLYEWFINNDVMYYSYFFVFFPFVNLISDTVMPWIMNDRDSILSSAIEHIQSSGMRSIGTLSSSIIKHIQSSGMRSIGTLIQDNFVWKSLKFATLRKGAIAYLIGYPSILPFRYSIRRIDKIKKINDKLTPYDYKITNNQIIIFESCR